MPQVVALVTEAAGGTWTGLGGRIKAVAIDQAPGHSNLCPEGLESQNVVLFVSLRQCALFWKKIFNMRRNL